jgi:hypothetical protein
MTGHQVALGVVHIHYKGGRYMPLGLARNSERREQKVVVYMSLDHGTAWVRPLQTPNEDSWQDMLKWPDGKERKRFTPEYMLSAQDKATLAACWERMAKEEKKEAEHV